MKKAQTQDYAFIWDTLLYPHSYAEIQPNIKVMEVKRHIKETGVSFAELLKIAIEENQYWVSKGRYLE